MPEYDDSLAKACSDLRKRWIDWDEATACPFQKSDLDPFSAGQVIEFLAQLLEADPIRSATILI